MLKHPALYFPSGLDIKVERLNTESDSRWVWRLLLSFSLCPSPLLKNCKQQTCTLGTVSVVPGFQFRIKYFIMPTSRGPHFNVIFIGSKSFAALFLFFNLVKGKLIIILFGVESLHEFRYTLYRSLKIFIFKYGQIQIESKCHL